MKTDRYPRIAVAGGGPAGCAAALSAADSGCDVLLFEAGSMDGDKACGDGLTPLTVRILETCGIDEARLEGLGAWPYTCLIAADDSHRTRRYPMSRRGWVLRRAVLHGELRRRVAERCRLHLNSRVVRMEICGGHPRLTVLASGEEQAFDVDAVVLANGSTGDLARQFGVCGLGREAVAVVQYSAVHRMRDAIRFRFYQSLRPGYAWWFPLGSAGVNWGACTVKVNAAALKPFRERMLRLARHEGYSAPRGGFARVWSGCGRTWHHPAGMVSCGDAAGLVDPYSGEGISAALMSGRHAGLAAASYLNGDSTALPEYSTWVRETFSKRYAIAGPSFGEWVPVANLW